MQFVHDRYYVFSHNGGGRITRCDLEWDNSKPMFWLEASDEVFSLQDLGEIGYEGPVDSFEISKNGKLVLHGI